MPISLTETGVALDVLRYRGRTKPSPPRRRKGRSWRLLAGATLTLGLIFTATLLRLSPQLSPRVLARVDGRDITRQDLAAEARAQGVKSSGPAAPKLLDAVIARDLLAGEARRRGLPSSPDFPSDRARADQQVLVDELLRSLPTPTPPTAAQISAFIAQHPDAFELRRRYTLEELRFDAAQTTADGQALDQARAQLQSAHVPFLENQMVVVGGEAPEPLRHALAAAAENETIHLRVGSSSALFEILSIDPAPIVGAPANAAALAMLSRAAREAQVSALIASLRHSARLSVSRPERTGARLAGVRR